MRSGRIVAAITVFARLLVGCAVFAPWGASALAAVTANDLVGDVVSDFGPRYSDLETAVNGFPAKGLDETRKLLAAAKKQHPQLPPARILLAELLLRADRLSDARAELEKSAVETPADPEPMLIFAELALNDGRIAEAVVLLAQSQKLTTDFKENPKRQQRLQLRIHSGRAAVAESRGQWPAAQEQLSAAAKLDPKNGAVQERLGRALFRAGKVKEALAALQTAAALDSGLPRAEVTMGCLYEETGDHKTAIQYMSQAAKKNPQDANTLLAVARWELQTSQLAAAKVHLENVLELQPDSIDARLLGGSVARLMQDMDAAERHFEAAHLQSPANFQATNLLAMVLADQDDPAKLQRALDYARLNAEKYPRNADALATLGWACYRLNRMDEAGQALSRAVAGGRLNAEGAYYAATWLSHEGQTDGARQLLLKSLETKQPFAYEKEARALLKKLTPAAPPKDSPKSTQPKSTPESKSRKPAASPQPSEK